MLTLHVMMIGRKSLALKLSSPFKIRVGSMGTVGNSCFQNSFQIPYGARMCGEKSDYVLHDL